MKQYVPNTHSDEQYFRTYTGWKPGDTLSIIGGFAEDDIFFIVKNNRTGTTVGVNRYYNRLIEDIPFKIEDCV